MLSNLAASRGPVAQGAPDFLQEFKRLMSLNASAVAVITCAEPDGARYGLAVTSVSSFSVEPPSVLICVNRTAEAHEPLRRAGRFGVNFLCDGQRDIANRFAGMQGEKNEAKYAGGDWSSTRNGVPILRDAFFWLECEVLHAAPILTHTVFIGKVITACGGDGRPAVYFGRDYVSIGAATPAG